ncbi:MAG: M10 family metallopeptidase C-terminal domain-containing protein [Elioraea sp.]|nr:M10 family metallopeptidase C-terminal domain-containing protein [Elioraea sp.]MDW8444435.1 M10 family metallopeptidase C-terminal domain-containing protein [Acetobacteraceae bacterium]
MASLVAFRPVVVPPAVLPRQVAERSGSAILLEGVEGATLWTGSFAFGEDGTISGRVEGCVHFGLRGVEFALAGAGGDAALLFAKLFGGDVPAAFRHLLAGDDVIVGSSGADVLRGFAGRDRLLGGGGRDRLEGGEGHDTIEGGVGDDHLFGEDGDDRLLGESGNDRLDGGPGADWLDGGPGEDRMEGGDGDDTFVVDHAADQVVERPGQGRDTVRASVSYRLPAEVEALVLLGVRAIDGAGNAAGNAVYGNDGANRLFGDDGDDLLHGGWGDDVLEGGQGADRLIGGPGRDVFLYRTVAESPAASGRRDTIADFVPGLDRIDLGRIDGDETAAGKQGLVFVGASPFTAPGQVRVRYVGENTQVQLNVDTDLQPEMEIVLAGRIALAAGDFLLG